METLRVMARELVALALPLLAHVAISRALFSDAGVGLGLLRPAKIWAPLFLLEVVCLLAIVVQSIGIPTLCIFLLARRYGAVADHRHARSIAHDLRSAPRFFVTHLVWLLRGDSRATAHGIRTVGMVTGRLPGTFLHAFLLILGYTGPFGAAAWLAHRHLLAAAPGEDSGMQLLAVALLPGGAALLAGAAHIGAIWCVECVMSVLEEEDAFQAMRMSDELLASSRLRASAAVFSTLDGCFAAVQLAIGALVVEDRMGLGVWLQVAAGVAMVAAAALWMSLRTSLVWQGLCKSFDGTASKNVANVGRRGRASRKRQ